jgi:hypothetical protein
MADPTVTDVFNQLVLVNGKLDQVEVNTSLMANVNTSINSGFSATVSRLNVLALIEVEAVKLLFHNAEQNDAIICILEKISKNTCDILTQVTVQTELQTRMADDLSALRFLTASAQPTAALELQRQAELQAAIDRCCPPPERDPACTYNPCDHPDRAKEPRLPQIDRKPDDDHVG